MANNAEKASTTSRMAWRSWQTIYYARNIEVKWDALFVPNSLLNQFRRETAEMLDEVRLANYARGAVRPSSACAGLPGHALPSSRTYKPQSACVFIIVTACSSSTPRMKRMKRGRCASDDHQTLPAVCF
ncbi:DUF3656 domain-containing protein [Enterobacter hormaechei]